MLDWFTGLVGYDGSRLRVGRFMELTPEGEVRRTWERAVEVEGSFRDTLLVGRGAATEDMKKAAKVLGLRCASDSVMISGNPTKWLQGHNVVGPSVSQLAPVIHDVVRRLPDRMRPGDADDPRGAAFHRSRVDAAVSIALGSDELVHEWLAAAENSTRSRHGRAQRSGTTIYWGQHSRRWTMKAYCKFCELKDHRPAESFDELRLFSEGLLRLEVTLRTPELKPRGTLDEEIVFEFWEKVVVGVSDREVTSMAERIASYDLPTGARVTLDAWLHGSPQLRGSLPERTWYHYRRLILEKVGVDISLPPAKDSARIRRAGFDVAYLKSRWVKDVPTHLQPLLFKPTRPLDRKYGTHP